jgi:molybdenum cofactor synthesis domain-containing protein
MEKPRAGVLTVSDSAATKGGRQDTSGPLAAELLSKAGFLITATATVPDEQKDISELLRKWSDELCLELVITTGGTGLFPRDVTPEATANIIEREVSGIQEAIRAAGMRHTPRAMLSRGLAGIRGETLVINLPGSPSAVKEGLETVMPVLEHAIAKIKGDTTPCGHHPHHNR